MLAQSPIPSLLPLRAQFRQRFSFGGVSVELHSESEADVHGGTEMLAFREFIGADTRPEIDIEVLWTEELRNRSASASFESGAIWRLFSTANGSEIEFSSVLLGPAPYKRMRADHSFRHVQIFLSKAARERCGKIPPLEYPACELLITNFLACHGLGVEVHGCGLIDRDTGGHLFLGHSGAGKSTTARLWENLRAPEILSDDRIILRLHDNELWMYGTPWHGEAAFALPGKAKLSKIHILRHGTANRFSSLPQARAVGEVFARSFPPFHSPVGVERSLEFIKRALDFVPCDEFEFLPDRSSVAAVLRE